MGQQRDETCSSKRGVGQSEGIKGSGTKKRVQQQKPTSLRRLKSGCETRVEELSTQTKGMKKSINPKVLAMIDNVEKREASLKKMLATFVKDKEKIEETVAELDRYKWEALESIWKKIATLAASSPSFCLATLPNCSPRKTKQDLMEGLKSNVVAHRPRLAFGLLRLELFDVGPCSHKGAQQVESEGCRRQLRCRVHARNSSRALEWGWAVSGSFPLFGGQHSPQPYSPTPDSRSAVPHPHSPLAQTHSPRQQQQQQQAHSVLPRNAAYPQYLSTPPQSASAFAHCSLRALSLSLSPSSALARSVLFVFAALTRRVVRAFASRVCTLRALPECTRLPARAS
ncbi:hypothetical protein K438DRAFT_1995005 [Mycena galopus ATCC 62051]|nr:hypothetical protein K438DRAFT_1995005 [Mycena galopus ATCC 62051]